MYDKTRTSLFLVLRRNRFSGDQSRVTVLLACRFLSSYGERAPSSSRRTATTKTLPSSTKAHLVVRRYTTGHQGPNHYTTSISIQEQCKGLQCKDGASDRLRGLQSISSKVFPFFLQITKQ